MNLIEIFARVHAKCVCVCVCVCVCGGGGVTDFKLGTFIGRFQSDGASSMAVKGLNWYFPN